MINSWRRSAIGTCYTRATNEGLARPVRNRWCWVGGYVLHGLEPENRLHVEQLRIGERLKDGAPQHNKSSRVSEEVWFERCPGPKGHKEKLTVPSNYNLVDLPSRSASWQRPLRP